MLLVVGLVVAALDWIAVALRRRALELMCKPAAAAAFLAAAVSLNPSSGVARTWFCVALAFCILGDIFLMGPSKTFTAGLCSFAVAQFCFAVGFLFQDPKAIRFIVGAVLSISIAVPVATRIVRALHSSYERALVAPVIAYMVLIFSMATSAFSSGTALGIAGATLFLLSDSLLAENRFVGARSWGPVAVMVTYHLALAGLVLALV